MQITLKKIKPKYMSESEIFGSEVYLTDLQLEKGFFYLIKGKSGSGKTSLLNFIFGKSFVFNGEIFYNNDNILKIKNIDLFRKEKISYVFQDLKLFPKLTAFENILLKNQISSKFNDEKIDFWLTELNILSKKNSKVETMSLGERQRVAIIRALCQPFEFLLLDEPFSHIDSVMIKKAIELIKNRCKEQNASLVLATLGDEYDFNFDFKYRL
jgi:putative ABC transport system ATP-binding protein